MSGEDRSRGEDTEETIPEYGARMLAVAEAAHVSSLVGGGGKMIRDGGVEILAMGAEENGFGGLSAHGTRFEDLPLTVDGRDGRFGRSGDWWEV